jgi:hypothetical protein
MKYRKRSEAQILNSKKHKVLTDLGFIRRKQDGEFYTHEFIANNEYAFDFGAVSIEGIVPTVFIEASKFGGEQKRVDILKALGV